MSLSKPIKDPCFDGQGDLTPELIKDHIVPGLGIAAKDTILKSDWDGKSAAIAVDLAANLPLI